MRQYCKDCRWEQLETLTLGSCHHPLTVAMRQATVMKYVPFAFKELEVTYVKRNELIDCPCFAPREEAIQRWNKRAK